MSPDHRTALQVGAALRRLRQERGARQCLLAEKAGITKAMLSNYERGRRCPALPTLVKILQALGCSAEEFGRHLGPWGSLP
jgi:transcriptional regulator with XRE-family HTH domain